jgi:hypothetical protein
MPPEHFFEWPEIKDEAVIRQGYGEYTRYYLRFEHLNCAIDPDISDLDISHHELNKLLIFYRGRYQHNERQKRQSGFASISN